jgi:cell division inhibitor SepF
MASMMKKAMIYLGLGPDEEYEQYEDYPAQAPAREQVPRGPVTPSAEPPRQAGSRPAVRPRVEEQPLVHPQPLPTGTVRPIPNDEQSRPQRAAGASRLAEDRPPSVSSAVRTVGPANAMPHAVSPSSFNDAQEIGDRFMTGQPVIVNLQAVDRDLRRRLVDFASGLCYAVAGKMERVADQVYLLTPADVEVPIEETRRHID